MYKSNAKIIRQGLEEANVVGTPGSGFEPHNEGYFRLTAFNTKENTIEAIEKIKKLGNNKKLPIRK